MSARSPLCDLCFFWNCKIIGAFRSTAEVFEIETFLIFNRIIELGRCSFISFLSALSVVMILAFTVRTGCRMIWGAVGVGSLCYLNLDAKQVIFSILIFSPVFPTS